MNLEKEWQKITKEIHKKSKKSVMLRELLFIAQIILAQLERGQNRLFNELIYKKTIKEYIKLGRVYAEN